MVKLEGRIELRVICGDTDQMGVVYYANYLRFFEAGRNEILRSRGVVYRDMETRHRRALHVAEALVNYRRPARYDDLLTVVTTIAEVGRASLRFEYQILRGQELIATGHTLHACVDLEGQVQRLPEDVCARLVGPAPE
jgi:acyl-CoA thioester hydrolase